MLCSRWFQVLAAICVAAFAAAAPAQELPTEPTDPDPGTVQRRHPRRPHATGAGSYDKKIVIVTGHEIRLSNSFARPEAFESIHPREATKRGGNSG